MCDPAALEAKLAPEGPFRTGEAVWSAPQAERTAASGKMSDENVAGSLSAASAVASS